MKQPLNIGICSIYYCSIFLCPSLIVASHVPFRRHARARLRWLTPYRRRQPYKHGWPGRLALRILFVLFQNNCKKPLLCWKVLFSFLPLFLPFVYIYVYIALIQPCCSTICADPWVVVSLPTLTLVYATWLHLCILYSYSGFRGNGYSCYSHLI